MNTSSRQSVNNDFFCWDPILGYRGKPYKIFSQVNPYDPSSKVQIQNNGDGFRQMPEQTNTAEEEKHQLAFLGSSWAWGSYVEAEDSYPSIAAQQFNCKACNFALPSYSPVQVYLTLKRCLELGSPTQIIIEQHPWNIHRLYQPYIKKGFLRPIAIESNQYPGFIIPGLPELARHTWYRRGLIRYLKFLIALKEENAKIPRSIGDASHHPIYSSSHSSYYDKAYTLLSRLYAGMKRLCAQKEIPMHVIILPDNKKSPIGDQELPRERLANALSKAEIKPLDLGEDEVLRDTSLYWPDGHPKIKGHQLIADRILQMLAASS